MDKELPVKDVKIEGLRLVHHDLSDFKAEEYYSHTSFFEDVLQRLMKNKGAIFGMIMIVLIVIMAVFMPMLSPYSYKEVNLEHKYLPPKMPILENLGIFDGTRDGVDVYASRDFGEDVYHYFGTDSLGRDLWTRLWKGTRISLIIAILAVAIDLIIGMSYGLISGYFGQKIDFFMQRFVEILNGIPQLVIITLFTLILQPGMLSIILALLISGWIPMSRVCRAQVLKQKEQEYVLAARTLGMGHRKIIFREIMPNVLGQVIIMSMFSIPSAIFLESYLAFIGLGVRAPMASLGSLVSIGYKSFLTYPFLVIVPVTVLALLMISFNLFADGLRDAFDPSMKEM
jgi:oligopeptide transport system permease protein